jgi:single-strand DNA-binding protein
MNMAKSVNKVILLGNVGKDPEIRSTAGGTKVASFSLATTERQKDASGNWTDRTEWHSLVAFNKLADIVESYVKKGNKLFIEGSLRTNSWEDKETKAKRYKTEIIVNDLSLLSGREEGSAGPYNRASSPASSAAAFDQRPPATAPDDYSQQAEISDDDIPF